ncbi:transporter substrate-binding domain-containing protein [Candidatus Phytoplasma asteris]|uniref:ABC-type amino acid transport system, substrate-binding protein n=1 Tax=Candidatus Phytoplasma asteris TaxID=85620 RepID=A0ABZ3CDW3_9MOLU
MLLIQIFLGKGYIKKLLNNRDIIKKETSSDDIGPNLEFIRNNKADIFVVDDVIAHYNTEGDKDLKYFILDSTDPQLQSGPNGVGVVFKKGDTKRQKEVNDALRKIFNLEYVKDKDGKDTDVIEDLKYILTRLHELKKEKRTKDQETRYKDLKGKNTRKPEEEKEFSTLFKVLDKFILGNLQKIDEAQERFDALKEIKLEFDILEKCLDGKRKEIKEEHDQLKNKKAYNSKTQKNNQNLNQRTQEEQKFRVLKNVPLLLKMIQKNKKP